MSVYSGQTPRELYRTFFRYLRHLPDPHVWSVLQPRVRNLLERSSRARARTQDDGTEPESSLTAELRARRLRRRAEDEVKRLHTAVGCHPHALRRVLADCYGRIGSVRWNLINIVMASHSPPLSLMGRPPIPAVLQPLAPAPVPPLPTKPRARITIPETAKRKAFVRSWTRQWTGVQVPLVVPFPGTPKTGWEDRGVVESLKLLAQIDKPSTDKAILKPTDLPTFHHLPRNIQRIYPTKLKPSPIEQYPPPPPRATRQNPSTWSNPHHLTRRLLRRTYKRLWDSLPWVRPAGDAADRWEKCTFANLSESADGEKKPKSRKEKKAPPASRRAVAWPGLEVDKQWLL